jgi:hypothetical protein
MLGLIRILALGFVLILTTSANAAELSPWMGSDDQAPFQLDPNTMVAVTFAADPLHTGSTTSALCESTGCTLPPKAAIEKETARGTPQN